MSAVSDATIDRDEPTATRRRWPVRLALGLGVLVVLATIVVVRSDRPDFAYDGPDGTVEAGQSVTIRDPDGVCGPLIVSIWTPSILGQWNQTHKGSSVGDSFSRDDHSWWKVWESETYATGIPCPLNGETTFTLPADVEPGTIAVCDSDKRCAKLDVT